jgi:hypothetical protein
VTAAAGVLKDEEAHHADKVMALKELVPLLLKVHMHRLSTCSARARTCAIHVLCMHMLHLRRHPS